MPVRASKLPSLFDSTTKSQSAKEQSQEALTVGGLTKSIRSLLEGSFADVVVEGEISNLTNHGSGHRYWTLKDLEAQISCVFWKTRHAGFEIKSGMKVVCRGRITVYPPRGNYQFDVLQIRPAGIGDLQKAFEELFQRLKSEGLFDISRKRLIPEFPRTIGIVTSQTGAALHDILTVLRRRYPLVRVVLRPAAVQGVGAELEIARAIQEFNLVKGNSRADVLIVGRGGGSLEDLWSFNEEAVARAIFASEIPVISAVGHEVDVTIADAVADLRAPTPTAAAELATPDRSELLMNLSAMARAMNLSVSGTLRQLREQLTSQASIQELESMVKSALTARSSDCSDCVHRIERSVRSRLERHQLIIEREAARLKALSPYAVLERGYAIVESRDGSIISDRARVEAEKGGNLVLRDGKIAFHV